MTITPISKAEERFNCQEFDDFLIQEVRLEEVSVTGEKISFQYLLDGEPIDCYFGYDSINLKDARLGSPEKVQSLAVIVAVLSCLRFATILPSSLDFRKFSPFIDEELLDFLKMAIPRCWSEHRYQLGKVAYKLPEIIIDESTLGEKLTYPLFKTEIPRPPVDVMMASGSGKDSLLCSLMLEKAGISYDIFTYLHDFYGDPQEQKEIFSQASQHLNYRKQHYLYIRDLYFPWLDRRIQDLDIVARTKSQFNSQKPFRTDAGEVIVTPFALAPLQATYGLPLLVVGHEKSADAVNTIEPQSGEAIAHQWEKSLHANQETSKLMSRIFSGINQVSLTKAIHDVKIFDLLFDLGGDLPYTTNSCNIQKPWCCRCEKCCYVFAGFNSYGDIEKVVEAFGNNLFEMEENLPIWEELLGLKGYIPWECVGLHEETQLYFYKLHQQGLRNPAIDLFEREILLPLEKNEQESVANYFKSIKNKFSTVYKKHHTMPDWLWEKLQPVLHKSAG